MPDYGTVPIPAGIYIGFEDTSPLNDGFSDFNYADLQVVVTDVTMSVPEPASWLTLVSGLVGLALIGVGRAGRRRAVVASERQR